MSERRITIEVNLDLAKSAPNAHAVTISKIAHQIAKVATEMIEENGYPVRRAEATTTLHYVRHQLKAIVRRPKKLRAVSGGN